MAILKNGAHFDGELLQTHVALTKPWTGRFAVQSANPVLIVVIAMRADRAIRPEERFHMSVGSGFVFEVRGVEYGSHGFLLRWEKVYGFTYGVSSDTSPSMQ